MQALILVGGKGTRLRPLTSEIPKPAVTLVDRPFLTYMIEWLAGHGVDEILLACGFLPDRMREILGEGEPGGPKLRYLVEPEPLGTAGAIKFAAEHLKGRFLALNGDSLTDLDLVPLFDLHEQTGSRATLGLYEVEDPTAFGLVMHDADGRVTAFLEKPEPGSPEAERAAQLAKPEVSAGIYLLEREVLDRIPAGRKVSIEREVFPALVGNGLHACGLQGYWRDIGTPERYLAATWDILEGRVKTRVPVAPDGVLIDPDASLAETVAIEKRVVVGPGCRIADAVSLAESVIHRDSRVGKGAVLRRCIVSPGAEIPAGARLADTVVGSDERITV